MQDNHKKSMTIYPVMFIYFIIAIIFSFVGFLIFIVDNILKYNKDIILIIVISLILLGSALMHLIVGIKIGMFDSIKLNENNLTVIRLGKSRRIITKQSIKSIYKKNGCRMTLIQIDLVCNENDDLNKINNTSLSLSYSPKRMNIINSWYTEKN